MDMKKILIIEDEKSISDIIKFNLDKRVSKPKPPTTGPSVGKGAKPCSGPDSFGRHASRDRRVSGMQKDP